MSHFLIRRLPTTVIAERWGGPGNYLIPPEHRLHVAPMFVAPGDYIVKRTHDDWYPLAASIAAQDYEVVKEVPDDAVSEGFRR